MRCFSSGSQPAHCTCTPVIPRATAARRLATAACAQCDATAVYMTDDGSLVCGKCGALLTLELTEVAPGK